MLHRQKLFEARQGGYHSYRIPGVAVTCGGDILVSVEGRRENQSDWASTDILLRRSGNRGQTWTPPRVVVDQSGYGPGPCSNFVMIPLPGGEVRALVCHDYLRVFTMVSRDAADHFVDVEDITHVFEGFRDQYPWRVVATGPGHGLRLSTGRLIVPLWMSDASGGGPGAKHRSHRPSVVATVFSDDDGRSWQRGEIVARDGDTVGEQSVRNPSESVAVERADGSVLMNLRSESDAARRLLAVSPDGVSGWQLLGFDEALVEPICMGSMTRLGPAGEASAAGEPGPILFANPATLEVSMEMWPGARARDRRNLTVFASTDDGASWPIRRSIEPEFASYSDLAPLDSATAVCVFENGVFDNRIGLDRFIDAAVFDLDFLHGGQ